MDQRQVTEQVQEIHKDLERLHQKYRELLTGSNEAVDCAFADLTGVIENFQPAGSEHPIPERQESGNPPADESSNPGRADQLGAEALPQDIRLAAGVLQSITDGLLAIDRDWRILAVVIRGDPVIPLNPEDLMGKNLWEAIPDLKETPIEGHLRQVMERRETVQLELKAVLWNKWYAITLLPLSSGMILFWQDFTSRKQVEAELERLVMENLRQSSLLDAIFDADPSGLAVLVGLDLRFAYVNPSYRYVTPDPVLDPIGKTYDLVWPKKSKYSNRDKFREVMRTGQPFLETGVDHCFPDGSIRSFTVQARRIEWESQSAILLIMWDTTELDRKERALRGSEARERAKVAELEALVEAVPALVWVSHDPECRVITGNSFSSEFLRMQAGDNLSLTAPEAEIPRHYRALRGGEEIPPDQLPVQLAAKGHPVRNYEFDVKFNDGEIRHLVGNAAPFFDEDGNPCGAVSAFVDITGRKRIEQALRESEKRLQDLIRYAPAGIYEVDFRTQSFKSVNDAMCQLSGYSREELLKMNPFEILDQEGKAIFQKRIMQWLGGEQPTENVEYRVRTKDGRIIDVILNVTFQNDENGKPCGATVVGFDITHQKQAGGRIIPPVPSRLDQDGR